MKQIIKFSIIPVIIIVILSACHREKTDFVGPGYISAPAGFAVTNFKASTTSINFGASPQEMSFNATFSSTVSWILTITGQQSGAQSIIKGTSNGLINEVWKGVQNNLFFFRTGEHVTATLSFYGTDYSTSLIIKITQAPNFETLGVFSTGGDFENPTPGYVVPYIKIVLPYVQYKDTNYSSIGWSPFNFPTPIPNVVQGIDSASIDYNGNKVPSVQGLYYYYMRGLGNQTSFVTGIQYTPYVNPALHIENSFFALTNSQLPADPNQVWVNIYIYGTGDANAQVTLEYQEDDLGSRTVGYVADEDDSWDATLTLNHTGWKLFSIKYSDLVITANKFFGGNGNHIMEPNRVCSWDIVLTKKTYPNNPVEVYFDYPIITKGGPFIPYK